MSITLDLLIGPSKTLAKKLCPPSAPGYWVEAPPGEQFGIKLVSTAAEPLSATVFIDNVQIKSIVLLPGNSVVLEHCVVDYTPAGYEIRRCFIFSAPKVVAHNEVPTAGPLDSAAQLGSVRVEVRKAYITSKDTLYTPSTTLPKFDAVVSESDKKNGLKGSMLTNAALGEKSLVHVPSRSFRTSLYSSMPTVIDTVEVHYACREGLVYLKVDPSLLSPRAEPKPSAAASGRAASAKQASGGPIDLTGDSDEEGPRPSQKAPMKRAKASGVVDLT